jgi:glutathione-specific gamma-glutamylcyclotransferase
MSDAHLYPARELKPPPGRGFWVFAYGSLMWKPGFEFAEACPALLRGYHRAFCIASTHYRGSREKPGLVLGLDRGGACRGRAYRVDATHAAEVARYLHEREMVGGVYEPRWLKIETPKGRRIAAAYVADRNNEHYAGKLSEDRIVAAIRRGVGVAGSNRDYLRSTVEHLDELGIADGPLHGLLRRVEAEG